MYWWRQTTIRWAGEIKLCLYPLVVSAETPQEAHNRMIEITEGWSEEQALEVFPELPRGPCKNPEEAFRKALEEYDEIVGNKR